MRDKGTPNIYEEEIILDEGFEVDRMLKEGLNGVWNKLMEGTLKPMYGTCKLIHLTTIHQIFILKAMHGWKNESVD